MNDGIMILLTPREIPRSHSRPEAATGCAGSYEDPHTLHMFMDTDTRNGHDICEEEQKSQPELRRNCLGRRKIKGKRFIDLRDSSDPRPPPDPRIGPDARNLPYETVRNWVREKIPADVFQKVLGTVGSSAPDLDAVVVGLLVKDLELAREILVDFRDLLPKTPVDGLLRTTCRPNYPPGKKIINEAVIVNPETVRLL